MKKIIKEDMVTPDFKAFLVIPQEEDFQIIADLFVDYVQDGWRLSYMRWRWKAKEIIKDKYHAVRLLIVASLFGWKFMVTAYKDNCSWLGYTKEDLKMLIRYVKDYQDSFKEYYENICMPTVTRDYTEFLRAQGNHRPDIFLKSLRDQGYKGPISAISEED